MEGASRPAFTALMVDVEHERYDSVQSKCTICDEILGPKHSVTYADAERHMWEHLAEILTYYSIRQKHGLNP